MASRTQWTWVWASSRSWWWTVKPGVLQSMGLQRVWHNWATELNFAYVESLLAVLQCLKPCTCFNWIFNFLKCFYLFTHLGQVLVSTPRIASLHASMPTVLLRQMESSSWTKDQTRPLHWKRRVLATGPPEKSLIEYFKKKIQKPKITKQSFYPSPKHC